MDQKALFGEQEYHLIEQLPVLGEDKIWILCADVAGSRYVCPEELWLKNALPTERSAPVRKDSASQEKIEFFLSVFRGRTDLYAMRYYSQKTGKSGYTPACRNEWAPEFCDKKAHKCPDCPNRQFQPLTADIIKAHLLQRCGRDLSYVGK